MNEAVCSGFTRFLPLRFIIMSCKQAIELSRKHFVVETIVKYATNNKNDPPVLILNEPSADTSLPS